MSIFALLIALLLWPATSSFAEDFVTSGSASTRYRLRTTGGQHDNDIETLLTLDLGERQAGRVSGAVQVGGVFDLDETSADSPFRSVYDTYGDDAVGRVYYGYVDIRDIGPVQKLRVGRQHRWETESLYFDGASLEMIRAGGVTLEGFGGVPVHLFENQIGSDIGDLLVGGALRWDPFNALRFRFDYTYLKDDVVGFRANVGDQDDHILTTSLWWDVLPVVNLSARFSAFLDQPRDAEFQTRFRFAEKGLTIRTRWYRLIQGYGIRVSDLDGEGFAGSYEPFLEASLSVTKELGDHFSVDVGYGARILDKEQISGAFNHGYQKVNGSVLFYGLPTEGTSFNLTADYYRGQDNILRNDSVGVSFGASQELLAKKVRVEGGSAYYLYRYNLFTGNESTNVRTYYAKIRGKVWKKLEARLGYEFENNAFDRFHTVDTRFAWYF